MKGHFARFLKHAAVYGVGLAGSKFGYLLLLPIYTRFLGPTEFGSVALFTVYLTVIRIVFTLGMNSSLFRSYFEVEEAEQKKRCIATALLSLVFFVVIAFGVTIHFSESLSMLVLSSPHHSRLIALVSLTAAVESLTLIPQSVLRAQEKSILFVAVGGLKILFLVILSFLFLGILDKGIEGIVYSWMGAAILIGLILMPFLARNVSFSFSVDVMKKLLSFGIPLLPSQLAIWFLNYSDQYFLGRFATLDAVGLYSLGFRISLVVNTLVILPFTLEWAPFMLDIEREDDARSIYSKILTYFALFAVSSALFVSLFADVLVRILATPSYYAAASLVPLMALSFVLYGVFNIFALGPTLTRQTIYTSLASCLGAFFALGGYLLLIPSFKSFGAAGSKALGYGLMTAAIFFFSQRLYSVQYEWTRILKIFLGAGTVYAFSTLTATALFPVNVAIKGCLFIMYWVLLYVAGLFSRDEIGYAKSFVVNAAKNLRFVNGGKWDP